MQSSSLVRGKSISLSKMVMAVGAVALSFALGVRTAGDVQTLGRSEAALPSLKADLLANPVKGDMDGNNEVTIEDAVKILEIAQGLEASTPEHIKRGDIDRDGKLTGLDALRVLKSIAER